MYAMYFNIHPNTLVCAVDAAVGFRGVQLCACFPVLAGWARLARRLSFLVLVRALWTYLAVVVLAFRGGRALIAGIQTRCSTDSSTSATVTPAFRRDACGATVLAECAVDAAIRFGGIQLFAIFPVLAAWARLT